MGQHGSQESKSATRQIMQDLVDTYGGGHIELETDSRPGSGQSTPRRTSQKRSSKKSQPSMKPDSRSNSRPNSRPGSGIYGAIRPAVAPPAVVIVEPSGAYSLGTYPPSPYPPAVNPAPAPLPVNSVNSYPPNSYPPHLQAGEPIRTGYAVPPGANGSYMYPVSPVYQAPVANYAPLHPHSAPRLYAVADNAAAVPPPTGPPPGYSQHAPPGHETYAYLPSVAVPTQYQQLAQPHYTQILQNHYAPPAVHEPPYHPHNSPQVQAGTYYLQAAQQYSQAAQHYPPEPYHKQNHDRQSYRPVQPTPSVLPSASPVNYQPAPADQPSSADPRPRESKAKAGVVTTFAPNGPFLTLTRAEYPRLKKPAMWIYVLRLVDDHYYVGRTQDVVTRVSEHSTGTAGRPTKDRGASWTAKYPVLGVVRVVQSDKNEEETMTKRYMDVYGVDKVRGGKFTQIKLSAEHLREIETSRISADDACHVCGQIGHFARFCPNRAAVAAAKAASQVPTPVHGPRVADPVPDLATGAGPRPKAKTKTAATVHTSTAGGTSVVVTPGEDGAAASPSPLLLLPLPHGHNSAQCGRCGRSDSHSANNCRAIYHLNGTRLSGSISPVGTASCARCGHLSHAAAQCYATHHVDGSALPPRAQAGAQTGASAAKPVSSPKGVSSGAELTIAERKASNVCKACKRVGHFMGDCTYTSYSDGRTIPTCTRCGRKGHAVAENGKSCELKSRADGTLIPK